MRRRDILAGAGTALAAGASSGFPAPAIAQGTRQLTMVTDWTETMPGLLPSARRLAQTIGEATKGRIKIEVFPANALVRPFETFDAVSAGVADMYHSYDGYFEKKSPALNFFCGVPFGFTANELYAWVRYGGGQELWDVLGGQFNIKPLLCLSTGTQMGGWFNDEITSLEGFKGLRYRMPGSAPILRRLGAVVVTLRRRDRFGAQVGRDRCQRMDRAVAGHGHRPARGGPLLLLSRLPRAGHRSDTRHQQARVGTSMRVTAANRGLHRRRIRANTGGIQQQQRSVAAQATGRRHRQDLEVRRTRC